MDHRGRIPMKDDLFRQLETSVREGGAILRGEKVPSRSFVFDSPDVRRVRDSFQLTQAAFATLLGISVKTLRNWEQGRRKPEGPARVLLQVAAKHPEAVWDVVRKEIRARSNGPAAKADGKQRRSRANRLDH
jgi:putative transcriptional regulator